MKLFHAQVLIWKDINGNYYGCHLNPPDFFPYQCMYACATTLTALLNDMKKTMQVFCNSFQKDYYPILPVPERNFHIMNYTFSFTPIRKFKTVRYPESTKRTITTVLVWSENSNGIKDVFCPREQISFSCTPSDKINNYAEEFLRPYYCNMPYELLMVPIPEMIDCQINTLHVSLKYIRHKVASKNEIDLPTLEAVAIPITRSFIRKTFTPSYGRQDIVMKLSQVLQSKSNPNLLLVGPHGSGKTTLLMAAIKVTEAQIREQNRILREQGVTTIDKCLFWQSNKYRLLSNTKWLGEWQNQINNVMAELAHIHGYLCLENISDLADGAANPEESVAAFLIPFLEEKNLHIIGEATPEELHSLGRLLPGFLKCFDIFKIDSMTPAEAVNSLCEMNKVFESSHTHFSIDSDVPNTIITLCRRFYKYRSFPGISSGFWKKSVLATVNKKQSVYSIKDVYSDFIQESGLPKWILRDELKISIDTVYQSLSQRVIGQPEACWATARAIINFKSTMNDPKRPIASFLFCGPTGVGKTQLVRTLSEYLFHNRKPGDRDITSRVVQEKLFRLDMSEYQLFGSGIRIIEGIDNRPSPLIEHIRRFPFSVILFDEIEKAAPDVFDILLNLLDEGRLTDRFGRIAYFQNAIIIMTSNLGSDKKNSFGFKTEVSNTEKDDSEVKKEKIVSGGVSKFQKQRYRDAVLDFFRPEFVNRIDDIVIFNELDRESCEKIVVMELDALVHREGMILHHLNISTTPELMTHLVDCGFSPIYGVRPLQRVIESEVVSVIANYLMNYPKTENGTFHLDWSKTKGQIDCIFVPSRNS